MSPGNKKQFQINGEATPQEKHLPRAHGEKIAFAAVNEWKQMKRQQTLNNNDFNT